MRYNICSPRDDGDYDVLVSIETDTIGKEYANEIAEHLQFTFANDEDERETVIIVTEDVHLLCGDTYSPADYSSLNSDEDDGQPDEAQEWHDFDPDC